MTVLESSPSPLSKPLPSRLSASEANTRMERGQRKAAALEARLQRQYESSLRATAKRCVEAYRKRTEVLVAAMPPKPPSDPQRPQVPQPTVDEVMQAELAAASANARTQATRRKIAETVAGGILVGFGPEPQLRGLLEPIVRAQAGVQAERLVAGTRDAVANILLDALVEGWTVPETAAYIGEVLTEQAAWRATMLARTDLVSLSNGAAHEAATILGDDGPQYMTWKSAGDNRVRPDHVEANNQTVPVGQPFDVGGEQLRWPGDPLASDSQTCNCRCVSIYSDSPAPTLRHSHDGGFVDGVAVLASSNESGDGRPTGEATTGRLEGGVEPEQEEATGQDLDELLATAFDPSRHPHMPKGERGGQWASVAHIQLAHAEHMDAGVSEFGDGIVLHKLDALKDGKGHGHAFMADLTAYADQTNKPIYLTPQQMGGVDGPGLSTAALEAWVGRHGFVWEGKHMVREPQKLAAAGSPENLGSPTEATQGMEEEDKDVHS